MYLVARSIMDRGVKQDYQLREDDVIKIGRVKFKVQVIYVQELETQKEKRKIRMQARKEIWELKEKQRSLEIAKREFYKKASVSESVDNIMKNLINPDQFEEKRQKE